MASSSNPDPTVEIGNAGTGLTAWDAFRDANGENSLLSRPALYGTSLLSPVISVDRLIAHVNDKEGGNWYGRPWTRALYLMWSVKDKALRVDAMKNERNGMGVPTIEAPPNNSAE